MKAELYYDEGWSWKLIHNGKTTAWGRFYTRKDSAKRGLLRFLRNVQGTRYSFIIEDLK